MTNLQERNWVPPAIGPYNDHSERNLGPEPSDFSPMFWLATEGAGNGRAPPVRRQWSIIAGIPMSYPLLIGFFLALAYLSQKDFVSQTLGFLVGGK